MLTCFLGWILPDAETNCSRSRVRSDSTATSTPFSRLYSRLAATTDAAMMSTPMMMRAFFTMGLYLSRLRTTRLERSDDQGQTTVQPEHWLSLIHISEPTRLLSISYAVFCL